VFGLKRGRGLRGQPLIIHDAGGQAAAAQTMRRAAPSNYISFTACYNWVKKKTLWSWDAPRVDLLREEVEVLGYQNFFTNWEQRLHDTQESRIIYRSLYISNPEISGETPFSYNSLAREESRTNTNNAVG
jgi:hypothetical protein